VLDGVEAFPFFLAELDAVVLEAFLPLLLALGCISATRRARDM
jgi:hypothetical protein